MRRKILVSINPREKLAIWESRGRLCVGCRRASYELAEGILMEERPRSSKSVTIRKNGQVWIIDASFPPEKGAWEKFVKRLEERFEIREVRGFERLLR